MVGKGSSSQEPLDTDLYRSRPRRKGEGWDEYYDGGEPNTSSKDYDEELRRQRTDFIREELARRRKSSEATGPRVSSSEYLKPSFDLFCRIMHHKYKHSCSKVRRKRGLSGYLLRSIL